MADVTIAPTDVSRAGINVTDNDTTVAASNNYYVANNGKVILLVSNAGGSNTFTVVTPNAAFDSLAVTDLALTLTASKLYAIGPFPIQNYNDSQNRLLFTVSAAADVMPLRVGI